MCAVRLVTSKRFITHFTEKPLVFVKDFLVVGLRDMSLKVFEVVKALIARVADIRLVLAACVLCASLPAATASIENGNALQKRR